MWTNTTRAYHARAGLALPSDLTDAEWAVLEASSRTTQKTHCNPARVRAPLARLAVQQTRRHLQVYVTSDADGALARRLIVSSHSSG